MSTLNFELHPSHLQREENLNIEICKEEFYLKFVRSHMPFENNINIAYGKCRTTSYIPFCWPKKDDGYICLYKEKSKHRTPKQRTHSDYEGF